jgi:catechol 2,3-dioxygenase-like lactoylglutathione lyase family enzyme
MIDHIALTVRNFTVSRLFYEEALKPLGYRLNREAPGRGGFGVGPKTDFWIAEGEPAAAVHVAFTCPDRSLVDAFHAAALAVGGRDNGAPGPRPQYHEDYYGAFVLDPDGNNLEAVCHEPPPGP